MSDLQTSEYLNRARNLLTDRYNKLKSAEYTQWMSNHKTAWAHPHTVVPFPPFVVCGALAPFKPSVSPPTDDQIVSTALELYNAAHPIIRAAPTALDTDSSSPITLDEEPSNEVTFEDSLASVLNETDLILPEDAIVDTVQESEIEPAADVEYVNEIYKIYQPIELNTSEPELEEESVIDNTVTEPPSTVAEPIKSSGGLLPSVLQRLQDMKSKWTTENQG